MSALLRGLVTILGLLAFWHATTRVFDLPAYILPDPLRVGRALIDRAPMLVAHAGVTLVEIVAGMVGGTLLGVSCGAALAASAAARRWLLPLLVASQALPVFALAPLLVLWFGYGFASKIAMALLITFFPVAIAAHDGMARAADGWIRSARVLGVGRAALLWHVRLPGALPVIAAGLRVAAAMAPIGAVIGEWVGASQGLGFVMLQANARMQIDLLFAALLILAAMAIALHALVDRVLRRLIHWHPDTLREGA